MGTHPIFESDFDCLTECLVEGFFPFLRDSPPPRPLCPHPSSVTSTNLPTVSDSTKVSCLKPLPSLRWLPSETKPPILLLLRTSMVGSSTFSRLLFPELKSTKLDERRPPSTTPSRSRAPGSPKTSTKPPTSTLDSSRPTSTDTDDTTSGVLRKKSRPPGPSHTLLSYLLFFWSPTPAPRTRSKAPASSPSSAKLWTAIVSKFSLLTTICSPPTRHQKLPYWLLQLAMESIIPTRFIYSGFMSSSKVFTPLWYQTKLFQ